MKTVLKPVIVSLFLIIAAVPAYADSTHPKGIKLDGTLGSAGKLELPGPDYDIKAEYGQQAGANLFHSFQQFNIHSDESATFTGPNSVQNIISRVTGGGASWINGRLGSTIPGADLYMLNPAGLMFGPNASLDLTGSFHVSTADYLRLGENERFYSIPHANDVLSVAAPAAFGFLNNDISPITYEGRGEITEEEWEGNPTGLRVEEGKTVSLVAGNIEIKKGTSVISQITDEYGPAFVDDLGNPVITDEAGNPMLFDENGNPDPEGGFAMLIDPDGNSILGNPDEIGSLHPVTEARNEGDVTAPRGRIDMAGVASAGEAVLTESGTDVSSFGKMGDVTLSDKSLIDVSGTGAGSVFIRGGKLFADDSVIQAQTLGDRDGGRVDIQADELSFTRGAKISCNTEGTGSGPDVEISASDSVSFFGENSDGVSMIRTTSPLDEDGTGDAGRIEIRAGNISFADGAWINSATYGRGKGGEVILSASDSVSFAGESSSGGGSMIRVASTYKEDGAGDAGRIEIRAGNISFADGAWINSATWGRGKGGEVLLSASDSVSFAGESSGGDGSRIVVATVYEEEGAGEAGRLEITADNISFADGTLINSATYGRGKGGEVILSASDSVSFAGESSGGRGSYIQLGTVYEEDGAGDAGRLEIEAGNISFTDGAYVNSATKGKGKGGEVTLSASDSVSFAGEDSGGQGSRIYMTTEFEGEGAGDAGRLEIKARNISFADGAFVNSTTYGKGKGGEVSLSASDSVSFAGEDSEADGSGIYMTTRFEGEGAGDGGTLLIDAKDISFTDGAYVDSGTEGKGRGGEVTLRAEETVMVTGASTEGNPSRIYAGSESIAPDAGDGGSITVSARTISLSDSGEISTSAAGSGNAGAVELSATELRLDTGASVSSGSGAVNFRSFGHISERDSGMLLPGDVVEAADTGDGTSDRYVSADTLTSFTDIYKVASLTELEKIGDRHALSQGDIAEVRDTGSGESARYVYAYEPYYELEAWVRFDSAHTDVTAADMAAIYGIAGWLRSEEELFHKPGDVIRVADTGDGRPGTYIYAPVLDESDGFYWSQAIRLGRFDAADTAALNDLPNQLSVRDRDVAKVADAGDGAAADFVFQSGEWIRFGTVHAVADEAAMNALTVPRTGYVAEVGDAKFVFSGREWVSLNEFRTVPDMAAMGNLTPETGDVVYVADTDSDESRQTPANFLYMEGGWTEFVKGDADRITITADTLTMTGDSRITTSTAGHGNAGDIMLKVNRLDIGDGASVVSESSSEIFGGSAGTITVEAGDSVRLSGEKALSTDAKGAGGGKIDVTAGNEIYLLNGGISSSVLIGVGKGGDVTAESEFVIMNHGDIKAKAQDGGGGAIFIRAENFLKSSDSVLDPSSKRGNDGTIKIEAPDIDVAGDLTVPGGDSIDASKWLPKACSERDAEDYSEFFVMGKDATPDPPNDIQASPPRPLK